MTVIDVNADASQATKSLDDLLRDVRRERRRLERKLHHSGVLHEEPRAPTIDGNPNSRAARRRAARGR